MPDLFDRDPVHAPGARRAPTNLNPAEWRELREWAEARVPWVSRGALGSLRTLEEHVDACLTYFRSSTKRRPGWLATVENWIRRDERERVERMAQRGDESARLACRDPKAWAARFDAKERAAASVVEPTALISPREPIAARTFSLQPGARP